MIINEQIPLRNCAGDQRMTFVTAPENLMCFYCRRGIHYVTKEPIEPCSICGKQTQVIEDLDIHQVPARTLAPLNEVMR